MTTDQQPPTGRIYEAMEYCGDLIDQFPDDRDKRSIIACLAERYEWSLQPSTKPLKTTSRKRGRSETTSMQWQPVIRPEEILHMEKDRQLVRLPGQDPEFCYKVPYYELAICDRRAEPNPYHAAV